MITSPFSLIQQLINGNKFIFNFYGQEQQFIDFQQNSFANIEAVSDFGPFLGGQFSVATEDNFISKFNKEANNNYLNENIIKEKEEEKIFLKNYKLNNKENNTEEEEKKEEDLPLGENNNNKNITVQTNFELKTTEKEKEINKLFLILQTENNNKEEFNKLNNIATNNNNIIIKDKEKDITNCGVSKEKIDKNIINNNIKEQLSPASSITAEVQRVSIDDNNKYSSYSYIQQQKSLFISNNVNEQKQLLEKEEKEKYNLTEETQNKLEGRTGIIISSSSSSSSNRTLRKYPAVEEEEDLLLFEQSSSSNHLYNNNKSSFTKQISSSSIVSPSFLLSEEKQLTKSFTPSLIIKSSLSPSLNNIEQNNNNNNSQLSLLQQQISSSSSSIPDNKIIKKEYEEEEKDQQKINREELFSTLIQQQLNQEQQILANYSSSLINNSTIQQQAVNNALANLIGHMQQQQKREQPLYIETHQQQQTLSSSSSSSISAPTSRLASIQEEQINLQLLQKQLNVENINNFEISRNQSTESTSSGGGGQTTTSLPIGENNIGVEPIPRKQDIQQDIRFNRGRFKLVRKRGRSEVWNLFGQVVDTLTNARLPYVACYACKVLYTDTGGGTGNMTRHRCQVGNSYRSSVRRSSSDTTVGNDSISFHQSSSSFESSVCSGVVGINSHQNNNNDILLQQYSSTSPKQQKQQQELIIQQQEQNLRLLAQQHQRKIAAVAAAAILLEQQQQMALKGNNSINNQSIYYYNNNNSGSSSSIEQQQLTGLSSSSSSSYIPSTTQLIFNKLFNNNNNINSSSSTSSSSSHSLISPTTLQQQQSLIKPLSTEIIKEEKQQLQHFGGLLSTTISPESSTTSNCDPLLLPPPFSSSYQKNNFDCSELNNKKDKKEEEEISFSGHHFTSADRQLFSQAVMNFCSKDLLKLEIIEGEGFQNLVETLLFIGRRSFINNNNSSIKKQQFNNSIKRQLIQTENEMKKIFLNQKQIVYKETLNDIEKLKNIGISLNCHQIEYGGELKYIISINYITDDWRITRRILKVSSLKELNGNNNNNKLTFKIFGNFISDILKEFNLNNCPLIIFTIEEDIINNNKEEEELNNLPSNIYLLNNINKELNNILKKCLLINQQEIIKIINLINKIIKILIKLDFGYGQQFLEELEQLNKQIKNQKTNNNYYDFTNFIYPSLKFIKENCSNILIFLDNKINKKEEEQIIIIEELQNINWQIFYELESFLEPFYETSQMFLDLNKPHFHKILPEWFALIHECQLNKLLIEKEKEKEEEEEELNNNNNIKYLFSSIRLSANLYLKEWANSNICIEHRVATALNPRLRHLPLICSDSERLLVYEKIREMAGLGNKLKQREENFTKNEPFRKRRRFLDQLEGCSLNEEEDELDFYLKTTFTPSQTNDILEFWSSFGEEQFPRLANLARFLLAVSFTPVTTQNEINNGNLLNSNEIEILLNLRPTILNSVNHQLAHNNRIKQQQ